MMRKIRACVSHFIGGVMGLIVIIGMFISTWGYNTDEVINFDPSAAQNQAMKVYHSMGNGFTSLTFANGFWMALQSIFQIILLIACLALIAFAVLQVLKTFGKIKEDYLLPNNKKFVNKWLDRLTLITLLCTFVVFVSYLSASSDLKFSLGLGSIFNFVFVILAFFGRKVLESKIKPMIIKDEEEAEKEKEAQEVQEA